MRIASILLGVFSAAVTLTWLTSCTPLRQADQAIWSAIPAIGAAAADRPAPPILELLASGLAVAGYGGMATWIHRSSKNGRRRSTATDATLLEISDRLTTLENRIRRQAGKPRE
jgi:hypothetical protein